MGQGIIALAGWQSIFLVYILIVAVIMLWFGLRQPETLAVEHRRPLDLRRARWPRRASCSPIASWWFLSWHKR